MDTARSGPARSSRSSRSLELSRSRARSGAGGLVTAGCHGGPVSHPGPNPGANTGQNPASQAVVASNRGNGTRGHSLHFPLKHTQAGGGVTLSQKQAGVSFSTVRPLFQEMDTQTSCQYRSAPLPHKSSMYSAIGHRGCQWHGAFRPPSSAPRSWRGLLPLIVTRQMSCRGRRQDM